jgi:hypothetical protein
MFIPVIVLRFVVACRDLIATSPLAVGGWNSVKGDLEIPVVPCVKPERYNPGPGADPQFEIYGYYYVLEEEQHPASRTRRLGSGNHTGWPSSGGSIHGCHRRQHPADNDR